VSLDLVGVADFGGFAVIADKHYVAARVGATRITGCGGFVMIDAPGIAYPARLFTGFTLVLRLYQHRQAQDHD
jgi:hypothetical protein